MRSVRASLSRVVLRTTAFGGSSGRVWFAGSERRAPSIAPFFAGDDLRPDSPGFLPRPLLDKRVRTEVETGGVAVLRLPGPDPSYANLVARSVTAPPLVDVTRELPGTVDALRSELVTSTTREDFRRIRRAGFTFRITQDPAMVRDFHQRHYVPLLERRFPDDGLVRSVEHMLRDLDRGGELICADIADSWVAGISNTVSDDRYELQSLGILHADESIRQKRVTAALLIRSLERGVELGKGSASLGRSLPFLGKGPVWFKAKWGGVISRSHVPGNLHVFMDLRNASSRRALAASPLIQRLGGDDLGAVTWLEPGEDPFRAVARDTGRFPGILRWHVVAEPQTLAAVASELDAVEGIVPIPVDLDRSQPVWLGDVLPTPGPLT